METKKYIDTKGAAKRLNEAINTLYDRGVIVSDRDLADKVDYNYQTFSQAKNGNERYLTTKFIVKFCTKFGFNASWMMSGKGDMEINNKIMETPSVCHPQDRYDVYIELIRNNSKLAESNNILAAANDKLAEANNALAKANDSLAKANTTLTDANRALVETNSKMTAELNLIMGEQVP